MHYLQLRKNNIRRKFGLSNMLDYTINDSCYFTTSTCTITYAQLVKNDVHMKTCNGM